MLFSRATEYAIRAILYVAGAGPDAQPVRVQAIAEALHVPSSSLAKVVQNLTRRGLLASHKGPRGGVTLAQPATKLTLFDVAEAVEGRDLTQRCVIGVPGCSERGTHCPLHEQWRGIRTHMLDMLSARSVDEVAQLTKDGRFVLGRRPGVRAPARTGARKPARRGSGTPTPNPWARK